MGTPAEEELSFQKRRTNTNLFRTGAVLDGIMCCGDKQSDASIGGYGGRMAWCAALDRCSGITPGEGNLWAQDTQTSIWTQPERQDALHVWGLGDPPVHSIGLTATHSKVQNRMPSVG